MVGLDALIQPAAAGVSYRRARVLAVNGRSLTVDLGGPLVVPCLDSCNPRPDQFVLLQSEGTSFIAIGAIGGVYHQATITVTAQDTNTVTGLVNGVSIPINKMGAYTATVGDVLPLLWSVTGAAWAGPTPGAAYVPPPASGGGGAPPPSGGSTYTYSYAAVRSGYSLGGTSNYGNVVLGGSRVGFFDYGNGRMYELHNKTILSGRIYLPRVSGSGSVSASVNFNPGSSSVSTGGWASLPLARLNELVSASSSVGLVITGSGTLQGTPAGTVQITWQ